MQLERDFYKTRMAVHCAMVNNHSNLVFRPLKKCKKYGRLLNTKKCVTNNMKYILMTYRLSIIKKKATIKWNVQLYTYTLFYFSVYFVTSFENKFVFSPVHGIDAALLT